MYGLSLGVSHISDTLPAPVYALLSGLNAATVGIIALAAVQLSQKAITDKFTRALVFFGGTAGMLYTALWYFPVLMVGAGSVTVLWDLQYPHKLLRLVWSSRASTQREANQVDDTELRNVVPETPSHTFDNPSQQSTPESAPHRRTNTTTTSQTTILPTTLPRSPASPPTQTTSPLTIPMSILLLTLFALLFLTTMLLRGLLHPLPSLLSLYANFLLAGTLIFGGGPVVIPLLSEYTVNPGFVTARDFLLGLALIQAFPGPNFNFATYLGSLAAITTGNPSFSGALIAYVSIFLPGLVIQAGFMGLWARVRKKRIVGSVLRGVHACAVGLVYTAVWRLWQIGWLEVGAERGRPLGDEAWWVVVTATSYVGGRWFGVGAPVAILLGGVMGLVRYGIVGR